MHSVFANACGKNETELKLVWNILEQGGKQKKEVGRAKKDEDDSEDAIWNEVPEGKGNEYRLLAWQERDIHEGGTWRKRRPGNPAPA